MPPSKDKLRAILQGHLPETVEQINDALQGEGLAALEPSLARLGRGGRLPHWYGNLSNDGTLPNLDGKTIGSIVEMLLVAVVETSIFKGLGLSPFRVNPARGIDLPDLDLGVKSPSENYCTSEPFFSAYERLYGSEYDALVLLTDYQIQKKSPPLRLQITAARYLTKTQIADESLCAIARAHRDWLLAESEGWAKKVFRFLAYVNQSDWRAKWLVKLLISLRNDDEIRALVAKAEADFKKQNRVRERRGQETIPDSDLEALKRILNSSPFALGLIDAADNWVVEILREVARTPSENEWNRLLASPLDGKIGMSFALQWRYNFGRLFGEKSPGVDEV